MKKFTFLFILSLGLFATSTYAACDLTDSCWYYIKSEFHKTYINFDSLPQESSKEEPFQVIKLANGKWNIKDVYGQYLTYSQYYAAAGSKQTPWIIEGNATDGYYISSEKGDVGYPGYFGPKDGMTKFYTNIAENTNCKFSFTPVKDTYVSITYQVLDSVSSKVKYSQVVMAAVGKPYPVPKAPNSWVIFTQPKGNVTAAETVNINYTSRYACFKSADKINQWYSLDIHGNEGDFPIFLTYQCDTMWTYDNTNKAYMKRRVAEGTADDYQNGAVMSSLFAWGFVGDPFNGVKICNKGNGKFAYFDGVPTGVTDRKKAPVFVNEDEEGASVFHIINSTSVLANGFCFQNQSASTTKNIINQKNQVITGYHAADGASAMRAWPITFVADSSKYTYETSQEYNTVILPFYSEIPEGLEVYSCAAAEGSILTLTPVKEMLFPNVPYIVKNTGTFNFKYTSIGNYTKSATAGLLIGVYEATDVPVGSYALQKKGNNLGFYKVAADSQPSVSARRCYLNVPESEVQVYYFDQATGIESLTPALSTREGEMFNLQGLKVDANYKGIVIKNGKKYLKK